MRLTRKRRLRISPAKRNLHLNRKSPPIQQAIGQAEEELDRKKRLPPNRQALIEQALSIHDEQSRILDELPKEQREKLMVMALHAFGELNDKGEPITPKPGKKRKKP